MKFQGRIVGHEIGEGNNEGLTVVKARVACAASGRVAISRAQFLVHEDKSADLPIGAVVMVEVEPMVDVQTDLGLIEGGKAEDPPVPNGVPDVAPPADAPIIDPKLEPAEA